MSIRIEDLPPAAQRQALQQLAEQEKQRQERREREKASKYHNQPDERQTAAGGNLRFDSRKEARRFDELSVMLLAGRIRDLKLQPQFTLQEAYTTPEGVHVRAIRYQADFSYERHTPHMAMDEWRLVVEDVKSRATKTRVYAIKKKLMLERYGIEITEI